MAVLDSQVVLQRVKVNLGLNDTVQDDLILLLVENVVSHFKLAYGAEEVADKFSFIIEDCVIKRFNRRGSEGATKEDLDGHSVTYEAHKNEFLPYDDLLKREFQTGKARPGGIYIL